MGKSKETGGGKDVIVKDHITKVRKRQSLLYEQKLDWIKEKKMRTG